MTNEKPKVCECCPTEDSKETPLKLEMTIWMCPSCITKNRELQAQSEREAPLRIEAQRNEWNKTIELNKIIQQAGGTAPVEVKSDIFVAETQSINEFKKRIDEDATVEDKNDFLAKGLLARYQQFKEKIFANNQENMELANKQNAIQKYLNELKNKLTAEQRAKYQLLDINYKPNKVKVVSNAQKKERSSPKKYDKAELHKAAERAGVPIQVIQMMCVAKHMTPMQASDKLLEVGSKSIGEKES